MVTPVETVLLIGVAGFDAYSFYKYKETEKELNQNNQARLKNLETQTPKNEVQTQNSGDRFRDLDNQNVKNETPLTNLEQERKPQQTTINFNEDLPSRPYVVEKPLEVTHKIEISEEKTSPSSIQELDSRVFNLERTLMTETHDRISRVELKLNSINDGFNSRLHELDMKIDALSNNLKPESGEILVKINDKLDDLDKKFREVNSNFDVVSTKISLLEKRENNMLDKVKIKLTKATKTEKKLNEKVQGQLKGLKTKLKHKKNKSDTSVNTKKSKTTVTNKTTVMRPVVNVHPIVKLVSPKKTTKTATKTKVATSKPKAVKTKIVTEKAGKGKNVEVNVKVK